MKITVNSDKHNEEKNTLPDPEHEELLQSELCPPIDANLLNLSKALKSTIGNNFPLDLTSIISDYLLAPYPLEEMIQENRLLLRIWSLSMSRMQYQLLKIHGFITINTVVLFIFNIIVNTILGVQNRNSTNYYGFVWFSLITSGGLFLYFACLPNRRGLLNSEDVFLRTERASRILNGPSIDKNKTELKNETEGLTQHAKSIIRTTSTFRLQFLFGLSTCVGLGPVLTVLIGLGSGTFQNIETLSFIPSLTCTSLSVFGIFKSRQINKKRLQELKHVTSDPPKYSELNVLNLERILDIRHKISSLVPMVTPVIEVIDPFIDNDHPSENQSILMA